MYCKSFNHKQIFSLITGTVILSLPLLVYGWQHFLRPPRSDEQRQLFQGIIYQRKAYVTPRPALVHIITIDLTARGIKPLITPDSRAEVQAETKARTTSDFLNEFKLQLAINGSYFHPFREITPWEYYPYTGDGTNTLGQTISNGKIYSPHEKGWYVLCFDANNKAQIPGGDRCPPGTVHGIAGSDILVSGGKVKSDRDDPRKDKPYPRVAAAIDKEGKKLWLVLVDGKQPLYSEGFTRADLTKLFTDLGVDRALNLDGGGSTTLAVSIGNSTKVLNAPIHTKIPMRERPVANHLGFYAIP